MDTGKKWPGWLKPLGAEANCCTKRALMRITGKVEIHGANCWGAEGCADCIIVFINVASTSSCLSSRPPALSVAWLTQIDPEKSLARAEALPSRARQ